MTAREIAQKTGACERSINRDLEDLQGELLRYPLTDDGRGHYARMEGGVDD